ncbi:MAG: carbohydrate-binding domain-containing protein [Eubacterium sp.]
MKKKYLCITMALILIAASIGGCGSNKVSDSPDIEETLESSETSAQSIFATADDMADYVIEYKNSDMLKDWKTKKYTDITFNGTNATINGSGATVDAGTLIINQEGYYVLTGIFEGSINISVSDTEKVYLICNGVSVTCSDGPAIYESTADKVIISLVDGTQNTFTDGKTYADTSENAPNAAIYCQDSLTINGTGTLLVNANYYNGITSKDKLKIMEGTINITAANTGILGRDLLIIKAGNLAIDSMGDGMKSTNADNGEKGIIYIEGGTFVIDCATDALQAENAIKITGGTFNITTGGGSSNASSTSDMSQNHPDMGNRKGGRDKSGNGWGDWGESTTEDTTSAKGIKAVTGIYISGGTFNIDSSDDSIHSNNFIRVTDGEFAVSSGDDGVHADDTMEINGGNINITKSYEGIEAAYIIVNNGDISVVSSDDGFNAAGGNDGSSINGRMGQNNFEAAGDYYINISGGTIYVDADGDGVDSNGDIYISGGYTIVNGPENNGNGAIDYAGCMEVSGGIFAASGSLGMAQAPSTSSSQASIFANTSSVISGESTIVLKDGDNTLISFDSDKSFSSIVITTPELTVNEDYILYINDAEYSVTAIQGSDASGMGGFRP